MYHLPHKFYLFISVFMINFFIESASIQFLRNICHSCLSWYKPYAVYNAVQKKPANV